MDLVILPHFEQAHMKDKNVAGILALFLGWLGVHRFYLGQVGRGFLYLIFCWFPLIWLIALIDAIGLLSMDQDRFDKKYNKEYLLFRRKLEPDFERKPRADYGKAMRKRPIDRHLQAKRVKAPANPYKDSGVKKFKAYDYEGAVEDFKKSLEIVPDDIATHFNLACAYSLLEKPSLAFKHLDLAVAHGFDDFERIKTHPALAFLRIQEEFEDFAENGFRLRPQLQAAQKEEFIEGAPDLLDQLKKLAALREKGLLTEEEFQAQKRKLKK